jgi:chaperonin GroES
MAKSKSVKKEVKKAAPKTAAKSAVKAATKIKAAAKTKAAATTKAFAKTKKQPAAKLAMKSKPAAKPTASAKAKPKAVAKQPAKMDVKAASAKLTMIKGGKSAFLMPLDDRLLVEKLVASDRTPGGLFIPDMAQERPTKGKVIAVGKGHRDAKGRVRPLDVKVGDVVLFTQWSGSEIELDGTTFLIMRETDLLGVSTD